MRKLHKPNWLVIMLKLKLCVLRNPVYGFFRIHVGALLEMACLLFRFWRGVRLRMKSGMNVERAVEYSGKVEMNQLEERIDESKDDAFLAQRQLTKTQKELDELTSLTK